MTLVLRIHYSETGGEKGMQVYMTEGVNMLKEGVTLTTLLGVGYHSDQLVVGITLTSLL